MDELFDALGDLVAELFNDPVFWVCAPLGAIGLVVIIEVIYYLSTGGWLT